LFARCSRDAAGRIKSPYLIITLTILYVIIGRARSLRVSLISHPAYPHRMTGSQIRFKMVSTLHGQTGYNVSYRVCLPRFSSIWTIAPLNAELLAVPPLPSFLAALLTMPNPYLMHHTCASILILVSTWPASRIFLVNRDGAAKDSSCGEGERDSRFCNDSRLNQ